MNQSQPNDSRRQLQSPLEDRKQEEILPDPRQQLLDLCAAEGSEPNHITSQNNFAGVKESGKRVNT